MTLYEILKKLEEEIKPELWYYCEDGITQVQRDVKETFNTLLDCIDELIEEREG